MKRTNIHVERARHKITQTELAEKVGTTCQSIHAIEVGKSNPSILLAIKIAIFFKVSVEYLFNLKEESKW